MTWPLTPWFPPSIRPARDRLYLTRLNGAPQSTPQLLEWSCNGWHFSDGSLSMVAREWCGLAFDPVAVERIIDAECYPQRVRYLWVVPAP